jgi:hypothetical protein
VVILPHISVRYTTIDLKAYFQSSVGQPRVLLEQEIPLLDPISSSKQVRHFVVQLAEFSLFALALFLLSAMNCIRAVYGTAPLDFLCVMRANFSAVGRWEV